MVVDVEPVVDAEPVVEAVMEEVVVAEGVNRSPLRPKKNWMRKWKNI